MQKELSFKKGKTPRNQLELPTLHFIVVDQWTEIIGEKAIFAWLKMYSWCKRDDQTVDYDLWEQAKIPTSFKKVIKRLQVGRDTFYNKILKPLWNVGLIDIEEFPDSDNKGTKPMNIIVYKFPQNKKALEYEPLEIIRDYDKDYHSDAKKFATKGGRPKNPGTKGEIGGGSKIEPPRVPKQNPTPFQNRTPGGSKIEPNNIFNSFSNSFNSLNNILNDINNSFNSSSSIHKDNNLHRKPSPTKKDDDDEEKQKTINQLTHDYYEFQYLYNYLEQKAVAVKDIEDTIIQCFQQGITQFRRDDLDKEWEQVIQQLNRGSITAFGKFFANGLKMVLQNKVIQQNHIDQARHEQAVAEERKQDRLQNISLPLYNWIEEE